MSHQTPHPAHRRAYRKQVRARREEETRRRIAQAAMELHGSVGPARTTISAVADRAGVQRTTVYRHFPDEAALFDACTAHWFALHPPPDPSRWTVIEDHDERLTTALRELYAWYASDERMFLNSARDGEAVPAMRKVVESSRRHFDAVVAAICRGRPERGRARRRVRAAVAHAASFATWHALVRENGLEDEEAIAVAAGMVTAAGGRRD